MLLLHISAHFKHLFGYIFIDDLFVHQVALKIAWIEKLLEKDGPYGFAAIEHNSQVQGFSYIQWL